MPQCQSHGPQDSGEGLSAAWSWEEPILEIKDYDIILNSMPETGIYVIREDNHGLLYFNERVRAVSPGARLGMPCHEVWSGSCINCPLLTIRDRQKSRSLSFNPTFGGVVDMVATRMLWKDTVPAFVVTVTPRIEAAGYTYRKILRLNLNANRYDVLKSDGGTWLSDSGTEDLSAEFANLVKNGMIHPEDADRFTAFTDIDHLKSALRSGKSMLTCIYRRLQDEEFRWNLIEVIPAFDYSENNQTAIFCVKDVHDTMREGLDLEENDARSRDALLALGRQSFRVYTIDLDSGKACPIRAEGRTPEGQPAWDHLLRSQLRERIHPAYQDSFEEKFSLEKLRQTRESGESETELLCQWENEGTYRYISVIAHFNQKHEKGLVVLALEDMDEQIRRELTHSQNDMQIAAILKSRYQIMNTVHLDNGQCERIHLTGAANPQSALVGDYSYHVQQAMTQQVHPEDAANYCSLMSLDHLREKAAAMEDYMEEVFQYRTREEPVRWVEQHIIYSRQNGKIVVNILGHDITREKSQENARLQALQDRAYIISSLSSLFFSTYYMDLERDTFRAVTQLGKVGDVLGSEVNCTAALQIYADNFIHPDDREEYLKTMDVHNLLQKLRWWQPYVTATYRKMSQDDEDVTGDYQWVRATAVLAQIGENDLPKTAVFVAQDITETRQKQTSQQ